MREDVAQLVHAERLVEAAALAETYGDLTVASELLERACDFRGAARAALSAGDAVRALTLAAVGGDDDTAQFALEKLRTDTTTAARLRLAEGLRQRSCHAWAARVYEVADANESAADAWERAGDAVRAAKLLEALAGGQSVVRAARVLEGALRREPDRADLRVALGGLFLRCGKPTPALRALQQVPDDAVEKTLALQLSLRALADLGMTDAAAEVLASLEARGERPMPLSTMPPGPLVDAPAPKARLYGRYEVVREVSSTATARLLECTDVLRGERVAVKLFSAQADATRGSGRDALAHFIREARVLAQLSHPNIVPLHDVLEQGPALVLEWMSGGTLETHLQDETFTPARAVDVACAVLGALGEAHRLGVVHRDLKPANILFDAAGTPRLSDFGVAHLGDLSVTATAGSFGSLAYMSPEQREGRPATVQSDLFGIGVVLFEMLHGFRPAGPSDVPPLSSVHRYLDARHDVALAALLSPDPKLRPVDAFTAQRTLRALPWPHDLDATRKIAARVAPQSVHPPALRLEPREPASSEDGSLFGYDRWLERPVTCLPLTPRLLTRAAIFASVPGPLQTVLRVDRDSGTLWLRAPRGAALSRRLTDEERAGFATALAALHAKGFVHGSVGRSAVTLEGDGPRLQFPPEDAGGTASLDSAALEAL